eukprot:7067443-Alexandrium_andersonii.AAC.1
MRTLVSKDPWLLWLEVRSESLSSTPLAAMAERKGSRQMVLLSGAAKSARAAGDGPQQLARNHTDHTTGKPRHAQRAQAACRKLDRCADATLMPRSHWR